MQSHTQLRCTAAPLRLPHSPESDPSLTQVKATDPTSLPLLPLSPSHPTSSPQQLPLALSRNASEPRLLSQPSSHRSQQPPALGDHATAPNRPPCSNHTEPLKWTSNTVPWDRQQGGSQQRRAEWSSQTQSSLYCMIALTPNSKTGRDVCGDRARSLVIPGVMAKKEQETGSRRGPVTHLHEANPCLLFHPSPVIRCLLRLTLFLPHEAQSCRLACFPSVFPLHTSKS